MTLMFIGTFNEPEQLEPPEKPEQPVSQTSTKKHSIPLVGEKDPMNPHARSATARCWSSPAGEGVLLVLSLARMRYGSPVMPWIGRYYAFYFWWLVTGDSWLGSHSSFVICRFARVGGHGSCTISYLTSGREDVVYRRDDFFLHLPDSFKGIRV